MRKIPETKVSEKIYAFDSLFTTNHIQMLKVLLPCLNPSLQRTLTLYIKFLELFYAMHFLSTHPYALKGCVFDNNAFDFNSFFTDMEPYLSSSESEMFKQIRQSMNTVKQFEQMQQKMETLKDILPEGFDFENMNSLGSVFAKMNSSFSGAECGKEEEKSSSDTSADSMMERFFTDKQKDLYEKFNERFQNL